MNECLARYGGLIWSIVLRRCHNRADAEDVVQEIFLDLWRSAHRFDAALATESTFVAMVTRRRLVDRQRKAHRAVATTSLDACTSGETQIAAQNTAAQKDSEISDSAAVARQKMSELREEERTVLELAIDHGLTQQQIAERTDLPLGTVKTHARRGLIRLREMLLPNPLVRKEASDEC